MTHIHHDYTRALHLARVGGRVSYTDAGYWLAQNLHDLLDEEGLAELVVVLDPASDEHSGHGIALKPTPEAEERFQARLLRLLDRRLPAYIGEVPVRRRDTFLEGLLVAIDEGLVL